MAIENQTLATPPGVATSTTNKAAPRTFVNAQNDPLLMALMALCRVLHVPQTADALVAGLTLADQKLTLELFPRAALRAGLAAALVKRPLSKISNLILPAVLLLKNDQACVLLRIAGDKLTILVPESGKGEKTVTLNELQKEYTGLAFFVQVQHAFDYRSGLTTGTTKKHWFWDVIFRSWPIYVEVLVASLLVNIFALAAP